MYNPLLEDRNKYFLKIDFWIWEGGDWTQSPGLKSPCSKTTLGGPISIWNEASRGGF